MYAVENTPASALGHPESKNRIILLGFLYDWSVIRVERDLSYDSSAISSDCDYRKVLATTQQLIISLTKVLRT